MFHIHIYHQFGEWKGSWGLSKCRCGKIKLNDLWGFQQEFTKKQLDKITEDLLRRIER